MNTRSAHDTPPPTPPLWQIVAARDYEVPTDSQPATLQRRWRALGRLLLGADDTDPARAEADLRALPQVRLANLVPPIDWAPLARALSGALGPGMPACSRSSIVATGSSSTATTARSCTWAYAPWRWSPPTTTPSPSPTSSCGPRRCATPTTAARCCNARRASMRPPSTAPSARAALEDVTMTSPYLYFDAPVTVVLREETWGTKYMVRAYPIDPRQQFRFVSELTVRGREALTRIGARPLLPQVSLRS